MFYSPKEDLENMTEPLWRITSSGPPYGFVVIWRGFAFRSSDLQYAYRAEGENEIVIVLSGCEFVVEVPEDKINQALIELATIMGGNSKHAKELINEGEGESQ